MKVKPNELVEINEDKLNLKEKAKELFEVGTLRQSTIQRLAKDYNKDVISKIDGGLSSNIHDEDIESFTKHASIRTAKMIEKDWESSVSSGKIKETDVKHYDNPKVRTYTPDNFVDGEKYAVKKYGKKAINPDDFFFPKDGTDPFDQYII